MTSQMTLDPDFKAFNSFASILINLEAGSADASLFARGCAFSFDTHDFDKWAYPYIQVFEPNVLLEVVYLNGLDLGSVERLQGGESTSVLRLLDLVTRPDELSDVWLANTIGALVSIARFQLAQELLVNLKARKLTVRGNFERAWLAFLIANRCLQGEGAKAAFDEMRAAAETNQVPTGRVLDLCTQGVVWHIKTRQFDEERFRWCLTMGARLSDHIGARDLETSASWYRGLAMLPARHKKSTCTRYYMDKAEQFAREAISHHGECGLAALNQLKTYFESSIKEFMYVDPNYGRALQAAQALVDLDPYWPLSLAEQGEVHVRFGNHEAGAVCFEKAAALGPPYVAPHLFQAANARARIGDRDSVLKHVQQLRAIAPDEASMAEIDRLFE